MKAHDEAQKARNAVGAPVIGFVLPVRQALSFGTHGDSRVRATATSSPFARIRRPIVRLSSTVPPGESMRMGILRVPSALRTLRNFGRVS